MTVPRLIMQRFDEVAPVTLVDLDDSALLAKVYCPNVGVFKACVFGEPAREITIIAELVIPNVHSQGNPTLGLRADHRCCRAAGLRASRGRFARRLHTCARCFCGRRSILFTNDTPARVAAREALEASVRRGAFVYLVLAHAKRFGDGVGGSRGVGAARVLQNPLVDLVVAAYRCCGLRCWGRRLDAFFTRCTFATLFASRAF